MGRYRRTSIRRPDNIKIQIKNGNTVVQEKVISNSEENVTFENLQKYDDDANVIVYTVQEAEENEGDLKILYIKCKPRNQNNNKYIYSTNRNNKYRCEQSMGRHRRTKNT